MGYRYCSRPIVRIFNCDGGKIERTPTRYAMQPELIHQLSGHCVNAEAGDRVFIPLHAPDRVINQVRSQLIAAYPGIAIILFRPNRSL
jgi:hypothetical protein